MSLAAISAAPKPLPEPNLHSHISPRQHPNPLPNPKFPSPVQPGGAIRTLTPPPFFFQWHPLCDGGETPHPKVP